MHFHVVTLFKEAIEPYFKDSLMARAIKKGIIKVSFYNPRDYSKDKWRKVDDRPYGGGPGMVLTPQPLIDAAEKISKGKNKTKVLILSPRGKQLTNEYARALSKKYKNLILISGRYEGIDARVKKILKAEEISIGPYVLSGGELGALVMIETISRQIPGFLGKAESLEESRTTGKELYTRPEVFLHKGKKYRVPKVLLSGHHAKITEWKRQHRS